MTTRAIAVVGRARRGGVPVLIVLAVAVLLLSSPTLVRLVWLVFTGLGQ